MKSWLIALLLGVATIATAVAIARRVTTDLKEMF